LVAFWQDNNDFPELVYDLSVSTPNLAEEQGQAFSIEFSIYEKYCLILEPELPQQSDPRYPVQDLEVVTFDSKVRRVVVFFHSKLEMLGRVSSLKDVR
jgi:hypothetical protein